MDELTRRIKLLERAGLESQIESHKSILRELDENREVWGRSVWDAQVMRSKEIIKNAQKAIDAIYKDISDNN